MSEIITDAAKKANIFNEYFVSQSTVPDADRALLSLSTDSNQPILSNIQTSSLEIEKSYLILTCLRLAVMIKLEIELLNCVFLVSPLTLLCNHSLLRGEFPSDWKKANVIPLFKKGDRQDKTIVLSLCFHLCQKFLKK